jgi:hypothetical protein
MTTEIATLNTANFAEMAQAMGMGADMNRVHLNHLHFHVYVSGISQSWGR